MFLFTWQDNKSDLSSRTVSFAQISKEVSSKLFIPCYFAIPHAVGILCQRCDSCVFQSRCWIMASKKAEKTSRRKFPVNATDCERAIIVETTNKQQQKYFLHEKGLGWGTCPRYLLRPAAQNGGQNSISDAHLVFYILSSTGKLYIRIDRGNAGQEGEHSRVLCWNEPCSQQLGWRQP